MQVILFWPVLTLVSRRMDDVKQSVRERYWVWRFTFPAALALLVGANALTALGLGGFVNADLVSTLSPLIPIVLITAGFLTPEPRGGGLPKPDAVPVFAKLAKLIEAKPVSAAEMTPAATRTYQREASRPVALSKPAHASCGRGSAHLRAAGTGPCQGRLVQLTFSLRRRAHVTAHDPRASFAPCSNLGSQAGRSLRTAILLSPRPAGFCPCAAMAGRPC